MKQDFFSRSLAHFFTMLKLKVLTGRIIILLNPITKEQVSIQRKKYPYYLQFINENGIACSHHIDDRLALFTRLSDPEPLPTTVKTALS